MSSSKSIKEQLNPKVKIDHKLNWKQNVTKRCDRLFSRQSSSISAVSTSTSPKMFYSTSISPRKKVKNISSSGQEKKVSENFKNMKPGAKSFAYFLAKSLFAKYLFTKYGKGLKQEYFRI